MWPGVAGHMSGKSANHTWLSVPVGLSLQQVVLIGVQQVVLIGVRSDPYPQLVTARVPWYGGAIMAGGIGSGQQCRSDS